MLTEVSLKPDTSTERRFKLEVTEAEAGTRLDKWLSARLAGEQVSRQRVQELIYENLVTVVGQPTARNGHKLRRGEVVEVRIPPDALLDFEPEDLKLDVVFEDEHLLVVDKPVGMLTHPTGANQRGTLVNGLLHHCAGRLSSINGVIRPGIVHRLDRDTQGLMLVAKTDQSHRALASQLKQRLIKRHYWAIAQGAPKTETGTVEAAIARHPQHRTKMRIDAEGRFARTHWRVEQRLADKFTWFHCELDTGRTHQIRLHLAHSGFPLVGDPLYGTGLGALWKLDLPGQLLQAYRLSFTHPVSDKTLCFEKPPSLLLTQTWNLLGEKLSL